jgi:Cupin superfamily protein
MELALSLPCNTRVVQLSRVVPTGGVIVAYTYFQPEPQFSESFGKRPFLFSHNLHTNDLFSIKAVEGLADIWSCDSSKKGFFYLDRKFREWGSEDHKASLVEAFRHSDLSRMRMKLSFIHTQPKYDQVLEAMTVELSQLTGVDLCKQYKAPMETLFLSSPNEFTPYHIDSEDSFLLQIQGTKTIYIFDGSDSEILNIRDIEKYWAQNEIKMREEIRSRATPFEMKAGTGVHIPMHFPHMVESGPVSSMSLSIGYESVQFDRDLYRVNHQLRKLGLNPAAPGKHKAVDTTKMAIVSGARTLTRTLKPRQPK